MLLTLLQIFAAYVLVDALGGIYHCLTDYGFNVNNQVTMFREHHDTNTMQGFDWQTFAAGMPLAVIGAWFHQPFLIALGVFIAITQVTHYYSHRRSSNVLVHRVVRFLQRSRIIVHPATHARHHREPFARNFCLLSGWNNWWLNSVLWICGL